MTVQHEEPMTGWRRWGAYVALTVVFAIACSLLSWWQWARRDQAVHEIQKIERNYDAEARPLDELLAGLDDWDDEQEWAPIALRGEYLVDEQIMVRNRVFGGRPGFEQLVPLQLDDGTVFVIDRGWLPIGEGEEALPESIPQPPSGEVSVIARLRESEPELRGRSAPEGQAPSIHVPDVVAASGLAGYTSAYGALAREDPAVDEMPYALPRPPEDEGPHLSYALQWIAFGILAFIGLVWAWRREIRIAALPAAEQAAARAPKRRHEDADAEDAILDRAEQSNTPTV